MKQSELAVNEVDAVLITEGPIRRAHLRTLRVTIEEIYMAELKIARLRRRAALLACGFVEPTEEELAAGDELMARRLGVQP